MTEQNEDYKRAADAVEDDVEAVRAEETALQEVRRAVDALEGIEHELRRIADYLTEDAGPTNNEAKRKFVIDYGRHD